MNLKIDAEKADVRYTNWLNCCINLIQPKNLYLVSGRATAKTSEILATRSQEIIYDMPGAYFAWIADTYVNAQRNVMPVLMEGWRRKGWADGKHFITDRRPPASWKKPYKPPLSYKHTISFPNGCFFNIVSADQPSSAAGNSYQHLFGDEVKYIENEKLKKLTPAIRGGREIFSYSPFFQGRSFTTDMPVIINNEHEWILENEALMDKEQIKLCLELGFVLNEIKTDLVKAQRDEAAASDIRLIQKNYERWLLKWAKARYNSTMFYIATSYINVDYLGLDWFDGILDEGIESFKTSVVSLKSALKAGEKFYTHLGEHHFFNDGNLESYTNRYLLTDNFSPSSEILKYCKSDLPLDIGVDFGNMLSLAVGQLQGNYFYVLKDFYTLPPESTRELAENFADFFRFHRRKEINFYYDRAGNQYEKVKRDWASEFADLLINKGWVVNMKSKNQATIYQEEEYKFMQNFLGEFDKNLPKIKIDRYNCPELRSSLNVAKTKIGYNRKGQTVIKKDKSSERKLPLKSLPMYSTNMSDAFKYLFCRNDWKQIVERRPAPVFSEPKVF